MNLRATLYSKAMRNDKLLAYKMRMQGKSYTEISKGLGVAKSTLSAWFQHLELSKEARERIHNKARAASMNALLKVNKQKTGQAEQRVKTARHNAQKTTSKISRQELLFVGATLYWAQGYKQLIVRGGKARTYHPISFSSADPAMAGIFVKFLKTVCGVEDSRIHTDLRVTKHQNRAQLVQHWSKATGLPYSCFKKFYVGNIDQLYGILQIRVNDTALFHTIMGWIEGLQNG